MINTLTKKLNEHIKINLGEINMQTKYEVQHYTLCDGWINTWTVDDKPEYFDTYEDAEASLAYFLK